MPVLVLPVLRPRRVSTSSGKKSVSRSSEIAFFIQDSGPLGAAGAARMQHSTARTFLHPYFPVTNHFAEVTISIESGSAKTKRERREGGRREGDGKKKNHDNLRQFTAQAVSARRLVWGTGPHPLEPGAVPAPKCNPLREVSANSPSQRAACRQLPSPRGRHCLPSAEARVPLREVVRGQPSRYYCEVVLSQLLREDICQG